MKKNFIIVLKSSWGKLRNSYPVGPSCQNKKKKNSSELGATYELSNIIRKKLTRLD